MDTSSLKLQLINIPTKELEDICSQMEMYILKNFAISIDLKKPLVIDFEKVPTEYFIKLMTDIQSIYLAQEVLKHTKC